MVIFTVYPTIFVFIWIHISLSLLDITLFSPPHPTHTCNLLGVSPGIVFQKLFYQHKYDIS